jgi:hypothetical protein
VTNPATPRPAAARAEFCARLRTSIPDIVDWWEDAVDREPWSSLSRDDRIDHLPEFVDTMIDSAFCASDNAEQVRRFIDAAARHGIQRRCLAFPYDIIMEESALLRRAIWAVGAPSFDDRYDMVNIDSALTVGLMASLRGYAKPELTQNGAWESSLTRLASDWGHLLAR